jgi:uncharacterized delta-60 repeat protein
LNIEQLESRRLLSAGDLGVGGQVEYEAPLEFVNDVIDTAILPDGKFLQGGSIRPPGQSREHRYFLRRLNADGTLDTTFGTGGTMVGTFPVDFVALTVRQMAVAPDGRIYMVGTSLGIARFNADGALDATFGDGDGVVETHREAPVELAIQPDGKLLFLDAIGRVTRYRPDGTLDASFGDDGVAEALPSIAPSLNTMVVRVLGDGKLLIGGRVPGSPDIHSALARLNPDGSLDTAFGDGGRVLDAIPGSAPKDNRIADIVLLPGGDGFDDGELDPLDDVALIESSI